MVDEPKPGDVQPNAGDPPAGDPPNAPAEPVVTPQGNEAVDEHGVPWKNRAAEATRKSEQLGETVEEMSVRIQNLEQRSAQPAQPAPQPGQPASKEDMAEFIALGPKAYGEKQQQVLHQKQKMSDAQNLITQEYGTARAGFGATKLLDYAEKNMIDLSKDPVRAVTKILADMKSPKKQISAEDQKKTAAAINNKPETGATPPPPPVNTETVLMDNVRNRGSVEDVAAAIFERFNKDAPNK